MGWITFQKKPMGSGTMKDCFAAEVTEGPFEGFATGTKCVIKVIKPSEYRRGLRISDIDINMQQQAANLVKEFNLNNNLSRKAYMRVARLSRMNGFKLLHGSCVKDGEAFIIEQRIHGEFQKFNSNTGWSSSFQLPDALSHWSWVHTGGQMLLCDLQGHRGRPGGPRYDGSSDYYLFTDPVLMSPTRKFGCTDLGAKGICTWFRHHRCNDCRSLALEGATESSLSFSDGEPYGNRPRQAPCSNRRAVGNAVVARLS